MTEGRYPNQHQTGACGITDAHSDEDHERLARVTKAIENTALVGRKATPLIALQITMLADPTVEGIAGILYLSGSKGGKAAALEAAKTIRRAL